MKAEIMISGLGEPQKEADNEKQRLGNGGDHTDIDREVLIVLVLVFRPALVQFVSDVIRCAKGGMI